MRDRQLQYGRHLFIMLAGSLVVVAASPAQATTNCTFTTVGGTMLLDGDCTTDETIGVPHASRTPIPG